MSASPDVLLERIRAATAKEYEVDRQIGAGGMATVFLARDIALDRPVAIKVMRPELIDVERVQDRFIIEARTAARLGHPGIVTVYSIKQGAGLLYIVMRYVEGRTLEEVLREQPILDPATAAAVVARVADALHFAHEKGIVHRDIKPSNIIIDLAGQPIVTDFGIARVSTSQGITMAGSMLGTPTYMSPEQCRGMAVTPASDQYSLGVMTYQMLAGRTPFSGEFFELIEAHKSFAPPPIGELVSGIDPMLEHTVMRMLAKDPAARWVSLAEVAQRLMQTSASPRELEQMRATVSFLSAARDVLTPAPSVASMETTPPPTRVEAPAARPEAAVEEIAVPAEPETIVPDHADPATPADLRVDTVAGRPSSSRVLLVGALLLAIIMITFTAIWSRRGANVETTVIPADSLLPRDTSASRPVVQPAASSQPKDSVSRPTTTARSDTAPAPSVPSPRKVVAPVKGREDASVECARLLERVSLGEKLTDAEQAVLRRRCRK